MDPLTIAMLAGSALKAHGDVQREKKSRAEAAVKEAYSPWSGVAASPVQQADTAGTLMQGIAGAASASQAADAAAQQEAQNQWVQNYRDKQLEMQSKWQDILNNQMKGQQAPMMPPMGPGAGSLEMPQIGSSMRRKRSAWDLGQ